jgi:Protein of unknown function (DUF4089)
MRQEPVAWTAYVDAMSALQRLPLDDARRAEVIRQMGNIEFLAQRFMDFPLEAELEPAPVFRP